MHAVDQQGELQRWQGVSTARVCSLPVPQAPNEGGVTALNYRPACCVQTHIIRLGYELASYGWASFVA